MIKKFKLLILFIAIIFALNSCGTIKKGFSSQKKNNNDEFLVEKKSPLLMPPNFDDMPVPNSNENFENDEENQVKKLLTKSKNDSTSKDVSQKSKGTFEENLLDKIKNN